MLRSLFISSSKIRKRLVFVILSVLLLHGMYRLLMYNYYQEDAWSRIMFHHLYESDQNIDNVYIGSSHVYLSNNPFVLDELTGENNHNVSTGMQHLISSYYLLKEVLADNKPKRVFLEMYYTPSTGVLGDYSNEYAILNMWRNTDYMKWSINKLQAIWDENPKSFLISAVLPFTRYRQYLFDVDYIRGRHVEKGTDEHRAFKYRQETERGVKEYQEKGYYYTDWEIVNPVYEAERTEQQMNMSADAEKYLRKIITLCQKKGIEITLYATPVYELQMLSVGNYDIYREKVAQIAQEYGIRYFDFNLIKDSYLPVQDVKYYYDPGHFNATGAEMFTRLFYELVYAGSDKAEDAFYTTYEEKLASLPDKTWGVYYSTDGNGKKVYTLAVSGMSEKTYKIMVTPDEGEAYMLQDFDSNKVFRIENGGSGKVQIETKLADGSVSSLEFKYE